MKKSRLFHLKNKATTARRLCNDAAGRISPLLTTHVCIGKSMAGAPDRSIILFPTRTTLLSCGLAGVVAMKNVAGGEERVDAAAPGEMAAALEKSGLSRCLEGDLGLEAGYLTGDEALATLWRSVRQMKSAGLFAQLIHNPPLVRELTSLAKRLTVLADVETRAFTARMGRLDPEDVRVVSRRLERVKDIAWSLSEELIRNVRQVEELLPSDGSDESLLPEAISVFKDINAALNSIDRLEVRGRDSAGVSLMFTVKSDVYDQYVKRLEENDLSRALEPRLTQNPLVAMGARVRKIGADLHAVGFVYKVAAEIGSLGDNIRNLRKQIKNDAALQILARLPLESHTVSSHTRWASVGAISEANCHPVDNLETEPGDMEEKCAIHVCLNGDIDNFQELKVRMEKAGRTIPGEITTDTKIIPLLIEEYYDECGDVIEAFRRALNDFEGSHAVSMHTDLAPGKLFLGQRGSGQAIFIGISPDLYMSVSEVYGFIEETSRFIKVDGEKTVQGRGGPTQGQIYTLDQNSGGGVEGITAMYYDGTPVALGPDDVRSTEITSRDIDRQNFPHYFLKEISESPGSVEKTLQNRWRLAAGESRMCEIALSRSVVPDSTREALASTDPDHRIRRIYLVGQGTAGVAARACADILNNYISDPELHVSALKSSELSGFKLSGLHGGQGMSDTLVIAISQSGTTTDTNRTVDMVKERGAHTLAIVNRRDSDITFKVDGVMYTSSGRDIEMSVASTKAFYSQIIAGALLGLFFAQIRGRRTREYISGELQHLLELPDLMRKVLLLHDKIAESAQERAPSKTYWAAVGSGPNKASADEIRIKLSELCYKTISSDYIEDKKHIDLSSEPLIIVCAAGTRGSVIGDVIKDVAIFQAHKATPIVIADEGEDRFTPYAADVFHVPVVPEHLAPVLNTLVGHLWGYRAALAINEGSGFMHRFREEVRGEIDAHAEKKLDIYELVLEKSFRERIAQFYNEFKKKRARRRIPTVLGLDAVLDLTLLLKYLSGRLPVADFELDFGVKGTASNMLNQLFECLGRAINRMARPVDAIRHQAKTVTVGTSRISEKVEGLLFEAIEEHGYSVARLTNSNIIVLKNLQKILSGVKGATNYRVNGLNLLGEPTENSTIEVLEKTGSNALIPSRVENDIRLKGTKRIIVRQGNVYIGKGRADERGILIIPLLSSDPTAPNINRRLLLLNISFKEHAPLSDKLKALGGKYEHIKNIVQENSLIWEDEHLEMVDIEELFGRSAEKTGEFIASRLQEKVSKGK